MSEGCSKDAHSVTNITCEFFMEMTSTLNGFSFQ